MEKTQTYKRTWLQRLKTLAARFAFVYLSAIILAFFSEKVFWYVQGFDVFGIALLYVLPAFIFLWAIQIFQVQQLTPLLVAAGLYGLITEGVLTPVVYGNGNFDLGAISYPVLGWHAPLSVIFGWFMLREWLLEGKTFILLIACFALGLFWGAWSLTYWLPENLVNPELLFKGFDVGIWPVEKYIAFTFWVTFVFVLAQWLIGYFWPKAFTPTWSEKAVIILALSIIFFLATVPVAPIALLELPVFLGVIFGALRTNRKRETAPSLLEQLSGKVPLRRVSILIVMPIVASSVYWLASVVGLSENFIRQVILHGSVGLQYVLGWVLFLGGLIGCQMTNKGNPILKESQWKTNQP